MIPWLLIMLSSGPLVEAPEVICIHDVTGLSPSLRDITHITPTLTTTHKDC